MTLLDCPKCGQPVRLGATRISVNRKRGVAHYIAHMNGKDRDCGTTEGFSCAALKPYGKPSEADKLIARWNAQAEHQPRDPVGQGGQPVESESK